MHSYSLEFTSTSTLTETKFIFVCVIKNSKKITHKKQLQSFLFICTDKSLLPKKKKYTNPSNSLAVLWMNDWMMKCGGEWKTKNKHTENISYKNKIIWRKCSCNVWSFSSAFDTMHHYILFLCHFSHIFCFVLMSFLSLHSISIFRCREWFHWRRTKIWAFSPFSFSPFDHLFFFIACCLVSYIFFFLYVSVHYCLFIDVFASE